MKIRKKPKIISVISLVLCLSLLTACGSNTSVLEPGKVDADDNIVIVDASIAQQQSSNMIQPRISQPRDNVYTFDPNDKIQIVGWTGNWDDYNRPWEMRSDTWWNSAVSTYNGTSDKWETDNYMRWQNGVDQHNFLSYWPANLADPNSDLTNVPVALTGSAEDDILLAKWTGERPDDNVLDLEFNHLMSRFDVHLFFRNEYTDVDYDSISIETNLRNTATVDLLSGQVTATSGKGIKMQASQHPDGNYHWSGTCITVPHEFNGELLTLKFIGNGEEKTINYEHTLQLNFRSGQRITLNLIVGKEKVELMDVTVTPWEIAPEINAGEAEEE